MQLHESLASEAIEYIHFPELGGRRKSSPQSSNTRWRNAAFRGYADYMETEDFRDGMKRLVEISGRTKTAIMCAEAVWWQCHRSLIADWLKVNGYDVIHMIAAGKTQEHPFTKAAGIENGKLSYTQEAAELERSSGT